MVPAFQPRPTRASGSRSGARRMGLRFDAQQQIVPGFDERLGALSLELFRQLAGVDAFAGETIQHGLAIPAIDGQSTRNLPMVGKRQQVASGMVFTVSGAARAPMYSVSEAFGLLVPVLAQSRRWAHAPWDASCVHRGEASRSR